MSRPEEVSDDYKELRKLFGETDEELRDWNITKQRKYIQLLSVKSLTTIYQKDQNIGKRIHDAFREAVSAAIEGKENFDELLAKLDSSHAPLATTGKLRLVACLFWWFCLSQIRFIHSLDFHHTEKQLLDDDESVKSFGVEVKKTVDSMASLIQENAEKGRRIEHALRVVLHRTRTRSVRESTFDADLPRWMGHRI